MHDGEDELRTHLAAALQARGRVLITGLGLGCVLRGVLASDAVESVDVVERERSVLDLVEPHLPKDDRIRIHHADALRWVASSKQAWDLAWHDLWANPDLGDEHLVLQHQRLLFALRRRTRVQGAWNFPRRYKRLLRDHVGLVG